MHLRLLHERTAGKVPVDGGAVAYGHQADAASVWDFGGAVQGEHPGREHVPGEGECGETSRK